MSQDPRDSRDPLDYGILLQDALRGLVRRSLEIVAAQGMPGDHHFYLSFRTDAPGVAVPPHLRDSYPEEMKIVLKTQFHDLVVDEEAFSVGLFFSGVRYGLTIPFASLLSFTDPSVGFQVAFQTAAQDEDEVPAEAAGSEREEAAAAAAPGAGTPAADNVVSLSGFRRKT